MISWDRCRDEFRSDRSLRDIYITQTTLSDWRAIYPLLRDASGAEFSVDGVSQPPPAKIEQAFAIRLSASPMLRFRIGRALVVFHFFSEAEIECDFIPEEITSQTDLDALLEFLRQLGEKTGKRVVVTPENAPEFPFISYEPGSGKFAHHEVAI